MRFIFIVFSFLCFLNAESANAQMGTGETVVVGSVPPNGFAAITNTFYQNVNWYLGYIPPYATSNFLIFVSGVQAGDRILLAAASTLPSGVAIANAYVYADNSIVVSFVTTDYNGSTIYSTPFTITVFR